MRHIQIASIMNLLMPFYLILIPTLLFSQEWVNATGQWVIYNITPEQAFYKAKDVARKEAVRKVLGTHIQQSAVVRNATFAGEFIYAFAYGHIIEEEIEKVEVQIRQNQMNEMPTLTCIIEMRCQVFEEKGQPDPSFKVKTELNSYSFTDGEEMIVNVRATQNCYITVLNISATDDIYVLFPNRFRRNNKVLAEEIVEFPSREDRDMGLRFRVHALPGHKQDREYIKVLATKKPIGFLDEIDEESGLKKFKNDKYALTELAHWLTTIPINERAEDLVSYIVVER